jgi:DNA repair protein RecN (Recombination protein N)
MLVSLTIQDFVIIRSLDLTFTGGLSALTGETGAGKSILLDALGIILGRRGDASLIRKGAEQTIITAEFSLTDTHDIRTLLETQSIPCLDHLVIRRILYAQGRSRAFVNDQLVTVGFLRLLGDSLVEIHGQFDRLMDVSSHRSLLDAYLCQPDLMASVRGLYKDWRQAQELTTASALRLDHLKRHEDFLRYQLKELEALNLREGEEEELLAKRENLSGFSKIFEAVSQAYQLLGKSQVPLVLDQAHRSLQKVPSGSCPAVDQAMTALAKGLSELTEALAQLEDLHAQMEGQPQQLQHIDDRLHQLRAVARKHNTTIASLPGFCQQLHQDLEDLDQAEYRVAQLRQEEEKKKQIYKAEALRLSQLRLQKARELDAAIMAELPDLKLPNARFFTEVAQLEASHWHEGGIDRVNFLIAMNKGQELCPLEKAASGGELARLMLSLKAILATVSCTDTIIFDEIDIGVGGAVAAAIGHRLAKLSETVQVLVITHSPQVAALADHHFQVSKGETDQEVLTQVCALPLTTRYEELARMLSGEEITHEARAAAKKLLARFG